MTARRLRYLHLDVFTDRLLEGNQLAVFPDAAELPGRTMQRIAQEMAFSESTFLLPPEDPQTDVRMRIFTPGRELPMAGHPTIGSTFVVAREGLLAPGTARFVFGLGIGPVPVDLTWRDAGLSFVWMAQGLPDFGEPLADPARLAPALGVSEGDLAGTALPVQEVSCGVPFLLVPMATRRAVDRAVLDPAAAGRIFGESLPPIFFFTPEPGPDNATVYSRMFAPGFGIMEDPATGSASGPLGCYLVRHGVVSPAQADRIVSRQGVRMGRPSTIHVKIGLEGTQITSVKVGGTAVIVGEGTLLAP